MRPRRVTPKRKCGTEKQKFRVFHTWTGEAAADPGAVLIQKVLAAHTGALRDAGTARS